MVKHTQTIVWLFLTIFFLGGGGGLALKGLIKTIQLKIE